MRLFEQQRGSVMFFVAGVIFPLLVVMFSLSLEFVSFFRRYETIQELVDNAAIQGTQSLPYAAQASKLVRSYIESRIGPQTGRLSVIVGSNGDDISVDLTQDFKLAIASYLGIKSIPYRVSARARRNPLDIALAIDFGAYAAPAPGTSWADPANPQAWMVSPTLSQLGMPFGADPAVMQEYLTQRCFNPTMFALKLGAINLFDTLSAIRLNAVGLAFFPDPSSGPFIVRPVTPAGVTNSIGSLVSEAQADTSTTISYGVTVSDANCGAIEDEARAWSSGSHPYKLPGLSKLINSPSSYTTLDNITYLHAGAFAFTPQYLSHLSAREAIWFRAARDINPSSSNVLTRLYNETLIAPALSSRGGLANSAERIVIILAADTPWEINDPFPYNNPANLQALKQSLDLFDGASASSPEVHLYYLLFPHQGNNSAGSLDWRVAQLRAVFAQYKNAHLLYADSPSTLSQQVVSQLNLIHARGVLAQ